MRRFVVAVDIGGTKLACALIDEKGLIDRVIKRTTLVEGGYSAVLLQIIEFIRELTYDLITPILGIGIAVAGQVDAETGTIISAPNLKWISVPLGLDLSETFSLPVVIRNDVRCATQAEWLFGAGIGCKDMACIFVGTGIGSGIVCNGEMLNGYTNTAGEIGHMIIDIKGPLCGCGNHGCFEAIAGGLSIANAAQDLLRGDPKMGKALLDMVKGNIAAITAVEVIRAYRVADPIAMKVMERVGEALIIGIANVINLFNPERIILGGGIIEGCPELIDIISLGIRKKSIKISTNCVEIVRSQFGEYAAIIGVAGLMHRI